jgi:hypothetical protein
MTVVLNRPMVVCCSCVIAVIHDYPSALHWYVHDLGRAPIHSLTMKIYQRSLSRLIR